MVNATFTIWRGEKIAGKHVDYTADVSEDMVVLDAVAFWPRRTHDPVELPL